MSLFYQADRPDRAARAVGAEVSLQLGEYTLGSGPDDDIQLIDVSVRHKHARLRLTPGKIEIAGEAGSLDLPDGERVPEGQGEWVEIQPLDIISTGTLRFTLGPPTAQWATLGNEQAKPAPEKKEAVPELTARNPVFGPWMNWAQTNWPAYRSFALPAGGILAVLILLGYFLFGGNGGNLLQKSPVAVDDVTTIRMALDEMPFGKPIDVRKEVDGTIYVSGFVNTIAERRGIVASVEKTTIPVRMRIGVLEVLRSELDNLIQAQKVNVTYTISPDGNLTLEGAILNDEAADHFVELVRENVVGINQITSQIHTARSLMEEVQRLAKTAQIDQNVFFQLSNDIIEVNGAIPTDKIDAWIGFLQSYARRFGREIQLRSYVQLQYDPSNPAANQTAGGGTAQPIILGLGGQGLAGLDLEKLRMGNLNLSDIFVGAQPGATANGRPTPPPAPTTPTTPAAPSTPPALAFDETTTLGPIAQLYNKAASAFDTSIFVEPGTNVPTQLSENAPTQPLKGVENLDELTKRAKGLLEAWTEGGVNALRDQAKNSALMGALDLLAAQSLQISRADLSVDERREFAGKYAALFARQNAPKGDSAQYCRPGSRLTVDNLPGALFWLDLLSTTNAIALSNFTIESQGFILEAALNPQLALNCLKKRPKDAPFVPTSIYLTEAQRNPDFVRFVTRSLQPFVLNVSGTNLRGRYVQTREGLKLREGSAPDAGSRIDTVGELGLSILLTTGYSTVIYGPNLTWSVQ